MSNFLRDQHVTNLSVDEDSLRHIDAVFESRQRAINADVPQNDNTGKRALLTYIIRFDNKGYRVFSVEDLLRYFHQAKEVERVIFSVETEESLRSARQCRYCRQTSEPEPIVAASSPSPRRFGGSNCTRALFSSQR